METLTIKPIDISVVKKEEKTTSLIIQEAQSLIVKTQQNYEEAGALRMRVKGKIKELEEKRKSIIVPLNTAKKNILALFSPIIERLRNAVLVIDRQTIAYSEEQDRKAKEAQAKAEEEARKAREKAEAKAKELADKGKEEKAQAMQEKADSIVAPTVTPSIPKVAGQSIQEKWYAEIIDFRALPDDYKLPDQPKLDKVAQATKGKISIAGVRFYSKKIVSGRAG